MVRPARSHVTLRPDAVNFAEGEVLPADRTYARDYSTEGVLGEGGMGRVFAGRDRNLGRRVAIKELRPEAKTRSDLWSRFLREAQIGGQLEHPNIVPIYAFEFSPTGGPAFVMQLIEGESLADYLDRVHDLVKANAPDAPTLKERIAKVLPVCDAVAYAHGRAVLHRDLKPDNVMLGAHNVVLVTDWGIARVHADFDEDVPEHAASIFPTQPLDLLRGTKSEVREVDTELGERVSSRETVVAPLGPAALAPTVATPLQAGPRPDTGGSVQTQLGAVMGTPQYMAPEQAIGVPVGPAADQFSLGLMLFELATLRDARSHDNATEAYTQAVLGTHAAHVDLGGQALDPRLSAIILRATAKEPADRYPSVEEFARDVRAFSRDEEVTVSPDSVARRLLRSLQKHPARSVGIGALILLLLAAWAIVSTSRAASRSSAARRDAEALSRLTAGLLEDGRGFENDLTEFDAELVGLAQVIRVRLESDQVPNKDAVRVLQPVDVREKRAPGLVQSPIDGVLRTYRDPVFVFTRGSGELAHRQALQIAQAKQDIIDLYVAGIDEAARTYPRAEQERLMFENQTGLVRIMLAFESGLFAQFPGRGDFGDDYDPRHTDWYKHAMQSQRGVFTRPKYGPLGKIPRLALVRAISTREGNIGAIAGGFWLSALVKRLGPHAAPGLVRAFVAAPDGKELMSDAVVAAASARQGKPEQLIVLPDVKSKRLRDVLARGGQHGYVVDGEQLFVYTRLAIEDWVLVHEYPRARYLELVR
ncbi:MAG TPA: protein kinase [Polyangiaceae bacterium]|nr:protein kinase [Polyangiaceae bacterium]